MFLLACPKHLREYREWEKQDKADFPDSTEVERTGRRLVLLATEPVDLDICPDCRVVSMVKM